MTFENHPLNGDRQPASTEALPASTETHLSFHMRGDTLFVLNKDGVPAPEYGLEHTSSHQQKDQAQVRPVGNLSTGYRPAFT